MMAFNRTMLVVFGLMVSGFTQVQAQGIAAPPASKPIDKPLEGISLEDLAEVVKATGFRAEIKPLNNPSLPNAQMIVSGMAGTPVTLAPLLCKDNLCRVVEFRARIAAAQPALTPVDLNKWNMTKNFARAYQMADGSTSLAAEIDMGGGMTIKALASAVRRFDILVGQFKTFDFKAAAGAAQPPAVNRGSAPERRI